MTALAERRPRVRDLLVPRLSRRAWRWLGALLLAGLAVRLALAASLYGLRFDIDSLTIVARDLRHAPHLVYASGRWPYPAGYFPIVMLCDWLGRQVGVSFHALIHLPPILADTALAWLVCVALRRGGRSERTALAGAALVALGPSFWMVSGYHGQIDPVATLPTVVAVLLWDGLGKRRGMVCGVLVGLGAAIKQPPGFTLLALWPTARSWRERAVTLVAAAVPPLVSVAPFLANDFHVTATELRANKGIPGFGGISAFVNPDLTRWWMTLKGPAPVSSLTLDLVHAQYLIVVIAVLAAAALLIARRVPPLVAATFIWLTVYAVNPNFGFVYLVWGLPFFLAAGYLREVAVLQLALLPSTVLFYWVDVRTGSQFAGWLYLVTVQIAWLGIVAAFVIYLRTLIGRGRSRALMTVPAAR